MDGTRPSQTVLVSTAFVAGVATVVAAIVMRDISRSLPSNLIDNVNEQIAKGLHSLSEMLSPQERPKQQQLPEDTPEPQDCPDLEADVGIEEDIPECQDCPGPEADVGTEVAAETEEVTVERLYHLPPWFLKNCVVTLEDLRVSNIPLEIRDSTVSRTDQEESYYELNTAEFEELRYLIQKDHSHETTADSQSYFNYDATILRAPVSGEHSGEGFLQAILQKLAMELGADMLILRAVDIELLCGHFAIDEVHPGHSDKAFDLFFKDPATGSTEGSGASSCHHNHTPDDEVMYNDNSSDDHQSDVTVSARAHLAFPFHLLLEAPSKKVSTAAAMPCDEGREPRPLLVLLPEILSPASNATGAWGEMWTQLREAVGAVNSQSMGTMIIGMDSFDVRPYWIAETELLGNGVQSMLSLLGSKPLCVQPMLPCRTSGQRLLLKRHMESATMRNNIDMLQKHIRQRLDSVSECALLEPYATWDTTSQDSNALDSLKHDSLDSLACDFVADAVYKDISIKRIEQALGRRSILLQWLENEGKGLKERDSSEEQSPWSNFPESAQNAIKRITDDTSKYEWENQLLDRLVNPDDAKHGWSDIELEDDVVRAITQIVDLANSDASSQTGLLRHSRINGALLYGPPGTGKTHLARVLAREYGAVMIHASAAEIESKWVGEAEKLIKGLFSLATMVAPSIIFIDEADGLFHRRRSGDPDWVRSRINTFLGQTDGLLRADRPPFLLLATNHPGELDEAVLRRVPGRLYIGLPTHAARENMLAIFLREENMEPEMRLGDIAAMTSGFTGSDLRSLCVQAALVSQAEAREEQQQGGTRTLRFSHFENAMRRCGPTVSADAIDAIRDFARKFDNTAADKLGHSYSEAGMAERKEKGRKKTPHIRGERGTADQVPSWMKSKRKEMDGSSAMSFDDWKNSEMYPYVTEELCEQWRQEAQQ